MDKLEIGFFIDSYDEINGVIVVMREYIKHLKDRANFFIACPRSPAKGQDGKDEADIIRCVGMHLKMLNYDFGVPFLDYKFIREIKQRKIDIIHVHSPFDVGLAGVKLAKELNVPVIATIHSQFKQDFMEVTHSRLLTKFMMHRIMRTFNACDEVWAVNEATKRLLLDEYKCQAKSTKVMPNATGFLPLQKDYSDEVCTATGVKKDEIMLLNLGRIVPLKNVAFVAKTMRVLKDKGFKAKLVFVGDGYYLNNLKKLVKKLDIEEETVFMGKITDEEFIKKLYQRADLFLFPSYYDTDGIVKFEAASQGTPTLFARGSLASSGIRDGVDGFIGENDVEAYADKIIEIFSDPEKLKTVGNGAKNHLYKTWEEVTESAFCRYLELIEQKKKETENNA